MRKCVGPLHSTCPTQVRAISVIHFKVNGMPAADYTLGCGLLFTPCGRRLMRSCQVFAISSTRARSLMSHRGEGRCIRRRTWTQLALAPPDDLLRAPRGMHACCKMISGCNLASVLCSGQMQSACERPNELDTLCQILCSIRICGCKSLGDG